jgi:hypothetical protein
VRRSLFPPKLVLQNPVLLLEIFNDGLLMGADPARRDWTSNRLALSFAESAMSSTTLA